MGSAEESKQQTRIRQQAERDLEHGRPERALARLRPFPNRTAPPTILRLRTRALLAQGHNRRAITVATSLVRITGVASDWLCLEAAHAAAGQLRAAEADRVAALRVDPHNVDVLLRIAAALAHEGRLSAAERALDRAILLAPKRAGLFALLGQVQRRAGCYAEARRSLRRAARLGATLEARLELAGVCRRIRRIKEAEGHLRDAVAEYPESALAEADLGDFLACEGGDEKEAAVRLERAGKLAPNDPDVRRLMACSAWRRGELAEARQLLTMHAKIGHVGSQLDLGRLCLLSGKARDRVRGAQWLLKAADAGDADAAYELAWECESGERIPPDLRQAVSGYARAAVLNHTGAQVGLAQLYAQALGVPRDLSRAARLFTRAATLGDVEAACALGELYDHGLGFEPDPDHAAEWYSVAAARGHARAQFNLGVLHDTGELGVRELETALLWLRRSARHGCASAEFYLGMLYALGDGVERDDRCATRWLKRAAQRDHAPAQYQFALFLLQGRGGFDDVVASGWLARAAELGLAEAQHLLGFLFRDGRGVPEDSHRAYWWFSLAARQDYPPAQVSLGVLLLRGEGVRADAAAAVRWFERAAEAGDVGAQRRLGHCYATGIGTVHDASEAFKWLTLAADAGDEEAAQLRDSFAESLSARARFEGRVRAHAYAIERDFELLDEMDR